MKSNPFPTLPIFLAVTLVLFAGPGCSLTRIPILLPTLTPSSTPSATYTVTPSSTFTPLPTETFTPSPTATFTASPLPTDTPLPTNTPRPTRPPAPPPAPTSPPGSENFSGQVISLVNGERAAQGLPALTVNWSLMSSAQSWSQFMAANNVFYHSGQNVAENIAAGYASPGDVVAAWMNSEGHRANILNPSYTQVGAGYAYSAGSQYRHYWTIQFLP